MIGDEMSGTLERRTIDPARGKSQLGELVAENASDLFDALEILGTAINVDDALEEHERLAIVSVDEAGERAFVGTEAACGLHKGERNGKRGAEREGHRRDDSKTRRPAFGSRSGNRAD